MTAVAPAVRSVDHIGIIVNDIDATLEYYVGVLGLPVVHDEVLVERSARIVFVDAGNVLIQLVQPTAVGALTEFLASQGEGVHHVCFAVNNIPETLRTIAAETSDGIFPGGRGRRACFLKNLPAGVRIELYEELER
ncbi:MAG: VOC family protein [Aeromicrobium sp.]